MTAAVYDGNGVRASDTFGSTTSYFAWDDVTGSEPRLLVDGTNAYIYALGDIPLEQVALSSGTVSYLLTDRLGSVRGIVSAAGSLSASTAYTGNNPLNATDPSGELFVCGSACTGGNGLAPASGGPGDGVAYQGTLATFDHADTASYDTGDGYGASVGAQVQNWAGYEDGIIPIPILKSCSTLLCDVVGDVGMALATADGGEVGDAVVGGADVIDAISGAVDGADDAAGTAPGAEEGAGALRVSGPEGSGPSLPMNWDSINAVSEKYGLDLSENDVNINSSIAVLRGSTAEDGTITLYRGAFDNEETLAKTLVHEQFHVDQLDGGMTYPSSYDPNSSFETSAEEYAQQWWLSQQ
jgi:hypothetical protein